HVVVGQDVTSGIDDDTASHAADPRTLVLLGGKWPPAVRRCFLLARDINHAWLRLVDRVHDGRTPDRGHRAGPGRNRRGHERDRRHAQTQRELSQKSLSASQQGHWHGGRPHCVRPRLFLKSSQPPRPVRTPGISSVMLILAWFWIGSPSSRLEPCHIENPQLSRTL